MPQDDDPFATERRWRWFGRIMLAVMAVALLVITLMAEG
jgi:hypothetical protein